MSGETESTLKKSAAEQQKAVEEMLKEYEVSLGIKKTPDILAEKYLTMTEEEMSRMTAEQCGYAAITLSQYAFYLQKAYNVELGRVNLAQTMVDRLVTPSMGSYKATSAPERKMLALKDNESAMAWEKLRVAAQTKCDRISYLPSKIDGLSMRFSELNQTKRSKQNV